MDSRERKKIRQAGAQDGRASRAGRPERVEDVAAAATLAGLLRAPGGNEVTLSGRCGTCGYLLTSAGHSVSCG